MNNTWRISIYTVLIILSAWFGVQFFSEYKRTNEAASHALSAETNEVSEANQPVPAIPTNVPATSAVATEGTNQTATNLIAEASSVTNHTTNVVGQATNAVVAASNATSSTAIVASAPVAPEKKIGKGKMMGYLGAFLGLTIVLGLLVAYDVTQMLGNRSVDFLFNEDLKGIHNPEYEEAEQAWANGKPLDAIQLMRDYLKKNPREQHVALRIAEIYEKDLGNHLAAALEYEQVLTHKLPRERWGWAAIHLCNLYSKMNQQAKCTALLRRIDSEYSETAAAQKARKRLALYESMGEEALGTDAPEDPNIPSAPLAAPKIVAQKKVEEPPSNLPPGFKPKK